MVEHAILRVKTLLPEAGKLKNGPANNALCGGKGTEGAGTGPQCHGAGLLRPQTQGAEKEGSAAEPVVVAGAASHLPRRRKCQRR